MECIYEGGGGVMDFSNAAVSQEGGNTFQGRGGGRDKRQHSLEMAHGGRKRLSIAIP